MKKLLLCMIGLFVTSAQAIEPVSDAVRRPSAERYDLLVAIKAGDRETVQKYCATDRTLDVSRQLSTIDDTPVHMAIRALINDYEKQADYERVLNSLGIWSFIGASVAGLTYYYKDNLWRPLAEANRHLAVPTWQQGLKQLASLSGNVLLLTAAGTITYMALRKMYSNGKIILRDRRYSQLATERMFIVEALIEHPSFNSTTLNSEGQTPLALISAEREKVKENSPLGKVLLGLEDLLLARDRKRNL
jgi:hypothetical protein